MQSFTNEHQQAQITDDVDWEPPMPPADLIFQAIWFYYQKN
ncbi:MAG TPA: hypothetical protein V6D15_22635 [Oculatellaceae cyanobacterium]|jgi:hypothetical protein